MYSTYLWRFNWRIEVGRPVRTNSKLLETRQLDQISANLVLRVAAFSAAILENEKTLAMRLIQTLEKRFDFLLGAVIPAVGVGVAVGWVEGFTILSRQEADAWLNQGPRRGRGYYFYCWDFIF